MGMDIGPVTREMFVNEVKRARTIIWNGPMGVSEFPTFAAGTRAVAEAVAANPAHHHHWRRRQRRGDPEAGLCR